MLATALSAELVGSQRADGTVRKVMSLTHTSNHFPASPALLSPLQSRGDGRTGVLHSRIHATARTDVRPTLASVSTDRNKRSRGGNRGSVGKLTTLTGCMNVTVDRYYYRYDRYDRYFPLPSHSRRK